MESGLSLEEIARHLNIRERYLIALEEGDSSALPGKVYANGYLKVYANYLGISLPGNLINDIKQVHVEEDKPYINLRLKKYLIITSILLLAIVLAIYYFIHTSGVDVISVIEIPNQANVLNDNNKSE
jgi:cytoskeletal protein RodZ